tara:strand:- start:1533 stop:2402 length:870 start_codon:yes stop_codon:yes gene_type:complete
MVCSHCKLPGHNFRGCPTITEEEKQKKIQENKEKIQQAIVRREERRVLRIQRENQQRERELQRQQQIAEQQRSFKQYGFLNPNEYEVAIYWAFKPKGPSSLDSSENIGSMRKFTLNSYVPSHSESPIRKYNPEVHIIAVFPVLEVSDNQGNAHTKMFGKLTEFHEGEGNPLDFTFQFPLSAQPWRNDGNIGKQIMNILCSSLPHQDDDIQQTFIHLPKVEYNPPKSELDQWKECGLRSCYLLNQLIKLGAKQNENLEPILDMIEDIKIPSHTEYDKEFAGVPSSLTNIT